jgi:hypothetical protein
MASRQHCAYNQTKECFLGFEVVAGDFSSVSIAEWMPTMTRGSGAGIWIVPSRGIPDTVVNVQLDLLYLDENCRVIEAVEFFPTFRVSPSSPPAASVLALPTHSIHSSETQPGDQLMVCTAEEMISRLERFSNKAQDPAALQDRAIFSEEQLSSSGSGLLQFEHRTEDEDLRTLDQTQEKLLLDASEKAITPPRSWLERWLLKGPPDHRKASRDQSPGLVAHFWTGGTPEAHTIRDISATGLYIVYEEGWYPGTLVRLTLTKVGSEEQSSDRSITVQARAVRKGEDGVGLEFVVQDPPRLRRGQDSTIEGADNKQLAQFLKRIRGGTS